METATQHQPACTPAIDTDLFISENLSLLALNATMARDFLEVGDSAGFRYSLACMIARAKAVAGLVNDLGTLADRKGA